VTGSRRGRRLSDPRASEHRKTEAGGGTGSPVDPQEPGVVQAGSHERPAGPPHRLAGRKLSRRGLRRMAVHADFARIGAVGIGGGRRPPGDHDGRAVNHQPPGTWPATFLSLPEITRFVDGNKRTGAGDVPGVFSVRTACLPEGGTGRGCVGAVDAGGGGWRAGSCANYGAGAESAIEN